VALKCIKRASKVLSLHLQNELSIGLPCYRYTKEYEYLSLSEFTV